MMHKIFRLYILTALFSTAGVFAFADGPGPSSTSTAQTPAPPANATAPDTQTNYLNDLKERVEKSKEIYDEAVVLYKNKQFAEAKKKFQEVSRVIPDYKATIEYLGRIDKDAQQEQERIAREQQKALQEQRRREEQERKRQEAQRQRELAEKERQHQRDLHEQAQSLYRSAVSLFHQKNMDEALAKFNDTEKIIPGFKSTETYIMRIGQWKVDQVKRLAQAQAEALRQRKLEEERRQAQELRDRQEAQRQKQLADERRLEQELRDKQEALRQKQLAQERRQAQELKEKLEARQRQEEERKRQEEERKRQEAQRQRELEAREIQHKKDIQEQAQSLYGPAVSLFDGKKMDEALEKFNVVEKLLPDFKSTRTYIARIAQWKLDQQKRTIEAQAEDLRQRRLADARRQAQAAKDKLEDQQKQERDIAALAEKSEQLHRQIAGIADDSLAEQTKKKMTEVDDILNNLKEKELAQEASDINDDIIRLSRRQDYEAMKVRFAQLADIVAALTKLKLEMAKQMAPRERERLRQRKLTEALEHQKRLEEEERSQQSRKEEMMRAQERERQRQEEKRLRLEKEKERQEQLRAQREAERQARLKAEAETREKIKEEKQREKERQEQLRAQREEERQARLKAEAETRKKIKEEKQREKERRQEEIALQETQRRQELELRERGRQEEKLLKVVNPQPQPQTKFQPQPVIVSSASTASSLAALEARREVVRKQLEEGVEAMYQEALSLYEKGDYKAAADKFKDVQDIIPGYKNTGQYMEEARLKSMTVNKSWTANPPSPSVSHQDAVSKTLDLFEANVQ